MPRRKKTKKTEINLVKKPNVFNHVKLGESYVSFVLGFIVIIISFVLIVSFLKGSQNKQTTSTSAKTEVSQNSESKKPELPTVYTVKEGDSLWSISENFYKSGYNFVDIARINNLENPEIIFAGEKLTIPDVKPIFPKDAIEQTTTGQTSSISNIAGDSYVAVKGDTLWDISLRAYGDGFKWPEIARVNNLVNPDLIHSGNIFKIPR